MINVLLPKSVNSSLIDEHRFWRKIINKNAKRYNADNN